MLEARSLGGKCADLNALFVGLTRAVGIPSRDIYGIRVADSAEFKSLGKSGDISKAQHCRAEFYLPAHGWVPVDPADVRKVVLEEKGGLSLGDATVQRARAKLFGAWEMIYLAYNYAHDVKLPNSAGDPIAFCAACSSACSPTRRARNSMDMTPSEGWRPWRDHSASGSVWRSRASCSCSATIVSRRSPVFSPRTRLARRKPSSSKSAKRGASS